MISSTQTNSPIAQSTEATSSTGNALQMACDRLKAAGLRITQPRIAILTALIKRVQPATIEQIHADLADASCDLVTVYRCLAVFEELNLVQRCYFHNGTSLYQIQLGTDPVYHVVSKDGTSIETLPVELARELRAVVSKIEESLKARGFSGVSHMAEFFGTAPSTETRKSAELSVNFN